MNKKELRKNFREAVFKRDGFTCKFCSNTENLDAHHITDRHFMPNGGYVLENGITLCPKHHKEAELWHISLGNMWTVNMHPNDLYFKINTSFEEAWEKSEESISNIRS